MSSRVLADIRHYQNAAGQGAVVTTHSRSNLITPEWFEPRHWGESAERIRTGGRGGAYVVHTPIGPLLLRRYLRGGMVGPVLKDRYFFQGGNRTRSFSEFFLTADLFEKGAPVPEPIAATYWRSGKFYRAAILLQFLRDIRTFGSLMVNQGAKAPWADTGRLIAKAHRHGLDHADLNAHNIVFNARGQGWLIDFDRSHVRIPETAWRENNLQRLKRSVLKIQSEHSSQLDASVALQGFEQLEDAYCQAWARGV